MHPLAGNGNPYAVNRNSGLGNLLLSLGSESDDESDDDAVRGHAKGPATSAMKAPARGTSPAAQRPGQQQQAALPRLLQQPIPGPTPIAALYSRSGPPPPVRYHRPAAPPQPQPQPSPIDMCSPHALLPPAPYSQHMLPSITPAFLRPSSTLSSSTLRSGVSCSSPIPILRGNTEETLIPSRGEEGDHFWRRFSIVAKELDVSDQSSWLKKSQSRSNRMTRFVWLIGLFFIVLILGGIGVGIWLTRNNPGHQQPTAIGGPGDHSMDHSVGDAGSPSSSIRHISPTNTVERRQLVQPTLISRSFGKGDVVW